MNTPIAPTINSIPADLVGFMIFQKVCGVGLGMVALF
jgi:hypothetical protein